MDRTNVEAAVQNNPRHKFSHHTNKTHSTHAQKHGRQSPSGIKLVAAHHVLDITRLKKEAEDEHQYMGFGGVEALNLLVLHR